MNVLPNSLAVVFFEFVHGDDLVACKNAVQQSALLRARDDQAQMHMKDTERNENEHESEENQPDVGHAHKARNPAHHEIENRILTQPVEHHQASDDFGEHHRVDADTIHLVMDNLNIHRRKSLTDLLGDEVGCEVWNRFTAHYTPRHGSWLIQAEIEIGLLSRQCLDTRRIPNLKELRREVRAWNRDANRRRVRINWKLDRKTARKKFGYKWKSIKRS